MKYYLLDFFIMRWLVSNLKFTASFRFLEWRFVRLLLKSYHGHTFHDHGLTFLNFADYDLLIIIFHVLGIVLFQSLYTLFCWHHKMVTSLLPCFIYLSPFIKTQLKIEEFCCSLFIIPTVSSFMFSELLKDKLANEKWLFFKLIDHIFLNFTHSSH